MFTQSSEYALRCLLHLARQPEMVATIPEISEPTEIPKDYLYKLVPALRRAGLIRVKRGRAGGVELGRAPAAISALDVLRAVSPWKTLDRCPLDNRMNCAAEQQGRKLGQLCALHTLLADVARQAERQLDGVTLQDFLNQRARVPKLATARR